MDQQELQQAQKDVRITQLEIDTKIIKSDISTIKNNHLKHIEKSMDSMDNKIDKLDNRVWAILFGIITLAATNVLLGIFNL